MILRSNLPTLDLHGMDREITRILVNVFINDNYKLNNLELVIIHGIGKGILRKEVHEVLRHDKRVLNFKTDNFNNGCTLVELKRNV